MAARQMLVPLDMTRLEVRNMVFHLLGSAPTVLEGLPYWNTATHCLEIYNGTQWLTFGRLDQIDAPTASVDMNSQKLINVLNPTSAQDAATRGYVLGLTPNELTALAADYSMNSRKLTSLANGTNANDAVNLSQLNAATLGNSWKVSVRAATTAAGTLASTFENGDIIDGVTLATGDRILIKDQASGGENGIYTVNASGAPTRATDADSAAELLQAAVGVQEGTANADTAWQNTTNAPITVGTTATVWTALPGIMVAGLGLTSSGSTMNVGAGTGIIVNANDVAVDKTDTNTRIPGRYAVDVGDGASTSIVITHNLNSLDVICQVYVKGAAGAQVECDPQHTSVNTMTLVFAVAPTSAQYRAICIG